MEDLLQRLGLNLTDLDITADTPASSLSEEFVHITSTPIQAKDTTLALWTIMEKLSLLAASKSFAQFEKPRLVVVQDDKPKSLGRVIGICNCSKMHLTKNVY